MAYKVGKICSLNSLVEEVSGRAGNAGRSTVVRIIVVNYVPWKQHSMAKQHNASSKGYIAPVVNKVADDCAFMLFP